MKANELRPGIAVNLDGRVLVVMKTDHVKPGKGPAYVQAKMRDIKGTGTDENRFSSSDNIDGATLDRREMEFLYESGAMFTFMDLEDYDQIEVLYWLDRSRRDLVVQNPGHSDRTFGTFALRSPVRPNPIGTVGAKLIRMDGPNLIVRGLDCLSGTPLIDLKPDRCAFSPKAAPKD